jgi:hypothetical protein
VNYHIACKPFTPVICTLLHVQRRLSSCLDREALQAHGWKYRGRVLNLKTREPPTYVWLYDPSIWLPLTGTEESSEDEYFSDASEGRRRASRPQTPASPIPRTRIERVDDTPAYGEVPGTAAYARRAQDAVPDEVEVSGRLSKRSSQYLEPPTTPGGTLIPRTVVEKVDPSSPSYGEAPGSKGYSHRKADSVPDLVLKAPEPGKKKGPEAETSPSSGQSPPIPETIVTRVDSNPAYGEVDGTKAKERRKKDAEPDVLEVKHESGKPHFTIVHRDN